MGLRAFIFRIVPALAFALAAGAQPLYGPATFTLAPGAPQRHEATFAAPLEDDCDGRAVYVITVEGTDAKKAVASATVSLNSAVLLKESDFSAAAAVRFTRDVSLQQSNQLVVVLNGGAPGAALTITVERQIRAAVVDDVRHTLAAKSSQFSTTFSDTGAREHVLLLRNGSAQGAGRVQSAAVVVNGVELVARKTFGAQVDLAQVSFASIAGLNRVEISADGKAGDVVTLDVDRVEDASVCTPAVAVDVAILSPEDGAEVAERTIVVRGTSSGPASMGVAVNGVAATLDLSHAGTAGDPFPWLAVLPQSEAGLMTISARAAAPDGTSREAVSTFLYAPAADRTMLRAFPSSGAAPLDVEIQLELPPDRAARIVRYELDLDGDGAFESESASPPQPLPVTFSEAGIRNVRVRMTDASGSVSVASVPVVVESFTVVNALLQAHWAAFTGALRRGDIEAALALLADDTVRAKYRKPLELIRPSLATFASEIGSIHAVYIRDGVGYYILTRTIDGVVLGYPVYFQRGADGMWRLVQF